MAYSFPTEPFFSDWWNNYLGRPWVAGGYGFAGFDCGGLVIYSTKFNRHVPLRDPVDGIKYTPEMERAARTAAMKRRISLYKSDWDQIRDEDRIDGTAVLMRRSGEPKHLGIWMSSGQILHADEKSGKVILDPFTDHQDTVLGFYLPKYVTEETHKH